jgi:hypothetical protein
VLSSYFTNRANFKRIVDEKAAKMRQFASFSGGKLMRRIKNQPP